MHTRCARRFSKRRPTHSCPGVNSTVPSENTPKYVPTAADDFLRMLEKKNSRTAVKAASPAYRRIFVPIRLPKVMNTVRQDMSRERS